MRFCCIMSSLSLSRKGISRDSLGVITFLFVWFIVSIISYLILKTFTDTFATTPFSNADTVTLAGKFLNALAVFDYLAILIVVALVIGIGYNSFRVAANPISFVITFLVSPILGLLSYALSYIFSQFVSQSVFSSVISMFPRTVLLGQNFHWIMLVCIVVGTITFFAKRKGGQEGAAEV